MSWVYMFGLVQKHAHAHFPGAGDTAATLSEYCKFGLGKCRFYFLTDPWIAESSFTFFLLLGWGSEILLWTLSETRLQYPVKCFAVKKQKIKIICCNKSSSSWFVLYHNLSSKMCPVLEFNSSHNIQHLHPAQPSAADFSFWKYVLSSPNQASQPETRYWFSARIEWKTTGSVVKLFVLNKCELGWLNFMLQPF